MIVCKCCTDYKYSASYIPNKLLLSRRETDIIHLARGESKKFFDMLRGVQKSFAACEGGGSKKFDAENFQLPSPPHQSISEHSLQCPKEVKYQQRVVKFKEEKKACEENLKAKQEALLDAEAKLKEERAQFERLEGCNNRAHGDKKAST